MKSRLKTSALGKLLEPGERVLAGVRPGLRGFLVRFVGYTLATGAVLYGIDFGLDLLELRTKPFQIAMLPNYLSAMLLAFLLVLEWLGRHGEALLTDRRLLRKQGLFGRRITVLRLSEISQVSGLEARSPRPVVAEHVNGQLCLQDLSDSQRFGRAVAEAAGLPIPTAPASVAVRAAGLLKASGTWGPVALWSFLAILIIYLSIDSLSIGPDGARGMVEQPVDLLTVLKLIIGGLVLFIVLLAMGIQGWILGNVIALLYLRPILTAEEIVEAVDIAPELIGSNNLIGMFLQPTLGSYLAALVFGRPNTTSQPPKTTPSR